MSRVSVVIPAYNNADFLAETIESILAQDFDDFELIISDHSSQDATWTVMQQFADDPRVTLMQIPAGGGARANWQAVTDAAGGELLKLVCGDDILYPGTLRQQVEAFDTHPQAALVANSRDILDAVGSPLIRNRGIDSLEGLVDGAKAVRASIVAGTNLFGEPACVMLRRELLQTAGGWDDRNPYLIDQASYARVLFQGPMVGIRVAGAGFRVNAGQWSVALAADQAAQAAGFHAQIAAEHPDLVSERDVSTGNRRARRAAYMRRLVYIVFARRLRMPDAPRAAA